MGRFFIDRDALQGDTVTIVGEDANHIARVLRYTVGDPITLCDGQKTDYFGNITAIDAQSVQVKIESCIESKSEPPFCATLYQALAKGDKMDTIVQKAVECGVCRIVPYESEHCVVRLDEKNRQKKQQRWQKIAQSAAEQSGRGIVPTVATPISFAQALKEAQNAPCAFLCYENEKGITLSQVLPENPCEIAFFVGPEGGFSPSEVQKAREAEIEGVGLGNRILRTETAAAFVLSALVYRYEL